jgi:ABC-2 type transport system ATP-binding protein
VSVNGQRYHDLAWPLREVGALLEARAIHPGRSARAHLLMLAQTNRLPARRIDDLLDLVGLTAVADQRAGKFSLGMGQRLGIAAALLGDPKVLLFDEPVNGLDPDGIRWVRNLLKGLAREGRTVFVSSHLMSEMALTADEVIIIGRGRLIEQTSIEGLLSRSSMQ